MNSKQIIRALNALFQLDDEDRGLVLKLWNLSESDREAFVQALQVEPQGKATTKAGKKDADTKKRNLEHCQACDYTRRHQIHKNNKLVGYHEFQSGKPKSQRASSIQQQIQGRGKTSTRTSGDDSDALCRYKFESGMICESSSGNPVHDPTQGYAGYHPFVSPSPARNAGVGSSSGKFIPSSLPASSATETESARSAALGLSGSD